MRFSPALLGAYVSLLSGIKLPELTREPRGIPEVSPTKPYYAGKHRDIARSNHRHRRNMKLRPRNPLKVVGPPAYGFPQRDHLVRLCGARITNRLERRILDRRDSFTFGDALAFLAKI